MSSINVDTLPRWKKVLFTLIPLAVFFVLMEVALRFTVPFQNIRVLCFHAIMERDYCPNVTGVIKYGAVLTINSDGMIDREYPVARTPGVLRVAVLGDSFTAGEEVAMGKRFHELWEQRLPKRLGRDLEILNFGVRGFGTWEQLQMFHLKAAKYRPDWTVLNLFWGNDIDDNINQFKNGAYSPLKEEYPENSLWNRILIARKNFNKWLWNHFATYQWFRTHYNKLEYTLKGWLRRDYDRHRERVKHFVEEQHAQAPPTAAPTTEAPKPGRLKKDLPSTHDDMFFADSEGWRVTQQLILKLKEETERAGGHLAVIHFLYHYQYHDYPELPLKEFNDFLTEHRIPHLDTYPYFMKLTPEQLLNTTLVPTNGDLHFSEYGHRLLANFSEEFLFNLLQPSGAPAANP